jgi:hypothetical protein
MSEKIKSAERYESFSGICCDVNADRLIAMLEKNLSSGKGDEKWHSYFSLKREQQKNANHDNLHFIGNQINILYEYLADCNDEEAKELLFKIEQECC